MYVVGFARLVFVALSIVIMLNQVETTWAVVGNLGLFAASNGYLQSLFCCYAPAKVDQQEQETLGNLMVIMITMGVSVGGLI